MLTTISLCSFFFGLLSAISFALNKRNIKSLGYFLFGIIIISISFLFFQGKALLPSVLLGVLTLSFTIGELTKNKISAFWIIIPVVLSLILLIPEISNDIAFLGFKMNDKIGLFSIALISALTPFITHLAKLGIGYLVIQFGTIQWAENEENYLESLVSYAFIGGIAVFGSFISGFGGILISGVFYLSASFVSRNKLGLKNDILLTAGSSILLILSSVLLLEVAGYNELDMTRGESIEGLYLGGFIMLSYSLFIQLSRFNNGFWKFSFLTLAVLIPIITIASLALAFSYSERLGGILSISASLISISVLALIFSLFKNFSNISLKLVVTGVAFYLTSVINYNPRISVESNSIQESKEVNDTKEIVVFPIEKAFGEFNLDENKSIIEFELGPPKGRTKGRINHIDGNLKLNQNLEKSQISITIPVNHLTTFNEFRDESLMSKEYFNEASYPNMIFNSSSIREIDDGVLISGEFSMLGKSKNMDIPFKLTRIDEIGEKKEYTFTGESELNRTDFGMSSDSKIGDIVSFTYQIVVK
jgi:polyisoprenoid-binding protein YceI